MTKKRHVTSLESVRHSTKEGANKGATNTFCKLTLDPGLNLPVIVWKQLGVLLKTGEGNCQKKLIGYGRSEPPG